MFYNKEKSRVKQSTDCICCQYFNKKEKRCKGIDKNCFVYDEKTQTAFDSKTKLPIKIN